MNVNPLPDASVDRALKRLKNVERSAFAIQKKTSPSDKIKDFLSKDDDGDVALPPVATGFKTPRRTTRSLPNVVRKRFGHEG